MDWISIIKLVGMALTAIFLGFLLKELIKNIKDDKEGKNHRKCDLD